MVTYGSHSKENKRMSTNHYKLLLFFIILWTQFLLGCNRHIRQNPVNNHYSKNIRIEYGLIYEKNGDTANIKLENGRKLQLPFSESFSIGDRVKVFYRDYKIIETEIIE